jgi:N-acetylmuramic acid 6-phosphate etherase
MAGLLALGVDRVDAETILKNCDGNLRRVFAELTKDRDRHPKEAAARKQGGAVEP